MIYRYLMKLEYDNCRTRAASALDRPKEGEPRSPLELLETFYSRQNGQPMGEDQRELARRLMEQIWGESL